MFQLSVGSNWFFCIDPVSVRAHMTKMGMDPSLIEKCNSLEMKHGPEPGRCRLLITKADYDLLAAEGGSTLSSSYFYPNVTIRIRDQYANGASTDFEKWTIVDAVNILGHPDNPESTVYLVLEDMRHWLGNIHTKNRVYNRLRHTVKNIGVSSGTDRYYEDTLDGTTLWNVADMLTNMIESAANPVVAGTLDANFLADYFLINVHSGDMTFLEWCSRCAEIFRVYYYIDRTGKLVFDGDRSEDSDFSGEYIFNQMKNLVVFPSSPSEPIEKLKFPVTFITNESIIPKYYNNESDIVLQLSVNDYPDGFHQDSDTSGASSSSLQVTLPHHYAWSDPGSSSVTYLPNSSYWNTYIYGDVAERARASIHPRMSYRNIRGLFLYNPRFEADTIFYSNIGKGLTTEVIGVPKHELNYLTPEFKQYEKELIREKWKYVLTSRFFYPNGYTYGFATADIYYPIIGAPRRTSITLYDLTRSLRDLTIGATGVCNQVGAYYYAECCVDPMSISSSSESDSSSSSESISSSSSSSSSDSSSSSSSDSSSSSSSDSSSSSSSSESSSSSASESSSSESGSSESTSSSGSGSSSFDGDCGGCTLTWTGSVWEVTIPCSPSPPCQCPPPFDSGTFIGETRVMPCTLVEPIP